jgi:indolepyruvate ferredoxin oxidoreductase alpha subunit
MVEKRILKLAEFSETFPFNKITWGKRDLGIVTSGVAYQYAREVFPGASFLKLGMTWPLPKNLIKKFAEGVKRLIVIEELDPFLQDNIQSMGIKVTGKEFIPLIGELNTRIVRMLRRRITAGIETVKSYRKPPACTASSFSAGCPYRHLSVLIIGQRSAVRAKEPQEPKLIVAETSAAIHWPPPLNVLIPPPAWARHRAGIRAWKAG